MDHLGVTLELLLVYVEVTLALHWWFCWNHFGVMLGSLAVVAAAAADLSLRAAIATDLRASGSRGSVADDLR